MNKDDDSAPMQELEKLTEGTLESLGQLLTGNLDDAQDVAQEVFIKLVQNADNLNRLRQPDAWLYRVTVNASRDYLRKQKLWLPLTRVLEWVGPADPVRQREIRYRLTQALQELSFQERAVFVLKEIHEIEIPETAYLQVRNRAWDRLSSPRSPVSFGLLYACGALAVVLVSGIVFLLWDRAALPASQMAVLPTSLERGVGRSEGLIATAAMSPTPVPASSSDVEEVVEEVGALTKYKSFEVVDAPILRTLEGKRATISGEGAIPYTVHVGHNSIIDTGDGLQIRVDPFTVKFRIVKGYTSASAVVQSSEDEGLLETVSKGAPAQHLDTTTVGIETSFTIADGETVVLGASRLEGNGEADSWAVISVVTARVI